MLGAQEPVVNGGENEEKLLRERPGARREKRRTEKQILEEQKKVREMSLGWQKRPRRW